jgi:hypothetical protein
MHPPAAPSLLIDFSHGPGCEQNQKVANTPANQHRLPRLTLLNHIDRMPPVNRPDEKEVTTAATTDSIDSLRSGGRNECGGADQLVFLLSRKFRTFD